MDSTALFSKTPPLKLFFFAAIPGAISMLTSSLYQTIDGIFVGQFLGAAAFAAINLAMPFVIINFSIADLVGVGSAVPISVRLGKKQEQEANNIFTCACLLIVGAGVIIGLVLFAAAPLLLRLMGAEGEVAQLAVQYMRVYALCSPLTTILMNAILIRLGGADAVSVYGVLMFVDGFIQPLLYGMCDSVQPAVGYNWGAQKFSRVRAIEKCCYAASAVLSVGAVFVIALIPEQITRLFISDAGNEVISLSVAALKLFCLTYITRWVSFATQSYMLAIEKPLPASVISICTALVFPIILIGLLWPLGLTGIWLNLAGTSVLSAVLSIFILRKLKNELRQPDAGV